MQQVRLGVVGAGIWGATHLRAYTQHPSALLTAVCDLDGERARQAAEQWAIPRWYTSLEHMLRDEKLDAVSVATPDTTHTPIVLACAEAGLHVLCEKPLATTAAECERMIAAAEAGGTYLMVDWHNRWNPPVHEAWQAIRKGELGDVRYVYYRLNDTIYVPTRMLPWAGKSSVMLFLGSHALDTICWLMDRCPSRVTCRRQQGVLTGMGIDTPDTFITLLDFADGAVAVVENSWILPQGSPSLIDHRIEILGTRGVIYVDPHHSRPIARYTPDTPAGFPASSFPDTFVTPTVHGRQVGFAVESIYHFVECVRDGKPPLTSGADGLRNTRLITAALQSAAENGAPVHVSE